MSNLSNHTLAERVREYIELFAGTMLSEMLQMAWDSNDLEQCRALVQQAGTEAMEYEFRAV
jgi:hypothetical protein